MSKAEDIYHGTTDPVVRLTKLTKHAKTLHAETLTCAAALNQTIRELVDGGMSQSEVARLAGLPRQEIGRRLASSTTITEDRAQPIVGS